MPFTALALLVAGALGACESEEPPMASPSPTASTTASPSPPATPSGSASSGIPAAAREKSEKGAEAFVRYFFDQVNVAWTAPRPGVIESLADTSCQFCAKTAQRALELDAKGQRYATDPLNVGALESLKGAPAGDKYFSMRLTQNEAQVIDGFGAVVRTDARKTASFNVGVRWHEKGWKFLEMEQQS
jgi:hypothetical protein